MAATSGSPAFKRRGVKRAPERKVLTRDPDQAKQFLHDDDPVVAKWFRRQVGTSAHLSAADLSAAIVCMQETMV
jgi:hypothetical protein